MFYSNLLDETSSVSNIFIRFQFLLNLMYYNYMLFYIKMHNEVRFGPELTHLFMLNSAEH